MANSLMGFAGLLGGGDAGATLDGKSKRFVTDKSGENVGFYSDRLPMAMRWLLGDPNAARAMGGAPIPVGGPNGPGGVPIGGGGDDDGGGTGGGPTTPPAARWAFPDYTQDWAFTPPAPFYTAPPPVFKASNYPSTIPSKKK
jgi:hypothetical protein